MAHFKKPFEITVIDIGMFFKWANPALFFVYFRSFSNKHYKF